MNFGTAVCSCCKSLSSCLLLLSFRGFSQNWVSCHVVVVAVAGAAGVDAIAVVGGDVMLVVQVAVIGDIGSYEYTWQLRSFCCLPASGNGHVPRVAFLKEGRSPSGPWWWWWLMLVHLSLSVRSDVEKMKSSGEIERIVSIFGSTMQGQLALLAVHRITGCTRRFVAYPRSTRTYCSILVLLTTEAMLRAPCSVGRRSKYDASRRGKMEPQSSRDKNARHQP